MTEQEWLTSSDPQAMLDQLFWKPTTHNMQGSGWKREEVSPRKLRLFAVACCRQPEVWGRLTDERIRRAVEVAERFADGLATREERLAALYALPGPGDAGWKNEYRIAGHCCFNEGWQQWIPLGEELNHLGWLKYDQQAALLRCIFGNPWRPATFDSAWLTPGVLAIAKTIYEERRWEDMPILADALEEAGCREEELLQHCRGFYVGYRRRNLGPYDCDMEPCWRPLRGPHCRGCWAIDLILGNG